MVVPAAIIVAVAIVVVTVVVCNEAVGVHAAVVVVVVPLVAAIVIAIVVGQRQAMAVVAVTGVAGLHRVAVGDRSPVAGLVGHGYGEGVGPCGGGADRSTVVLGAHRSEDAGTAVGGAPGSHQA